MISSNKQKHSPADALLDFKQASERENWHAIRLLGSLTVLKPIRDVTSKKCYSLEYLWILQGEFVKTREWMLLPTSKAYPKIQGMAPCYYAETGKRQTESRNKEKKIQELLIKKALLPTAKQALQTQLLPAALSWCCNTPRQTGRLGEPEHEQVGVWVFVWFGFVFFKVLIRKTWKAE